MSALPMPSIGLGTYLLERDQVEQVLTSAIQLGYRRIDCAPVYFNEDAVGDALAKILESNTKHQENGIKLKRSDLYIVSKLASPFHRKEHVKQALLKTLNDLRLDYLDLYLIHWPIAFQYVKIDPTQRGYDNEDIDDSDGGNNIDLTVSVHETWQALEACVDEGLVRHIGVSNFPVMLLHELLTQARIVPHINQCEAHPYLPQSRLVDYCRARGIAFQAYSPLGTPGYKTSDEPRVLDDAELQKIAEAHGVTTSQVCLAWALQRGTSVVVKSSNPQHQADNLNALQFLNLSSEEMEIITSLGSKHNHYRFFRPEDWWGSIGAVFD